MPHHEHSPENQETANTSLWLVKRSLNSPSPASSGHQMSVWLCKSLMRFRPGFRAQGKTRYGMVLRKQHWWSALYSVTVTKQLLAELKRNIRRQDQKRWSLPLYEDWAPFLFAFFQKVSDSKSRLKMPLDTTLSVYPKLAQSYLGFICVPPNTLETFFLDSTRLLLGI